MTVESLPTLTLYRNNRWHLLHLALNRLIFSIFYYRLVAPVVAPKGDTRVSCPTVKHLWKTYIFLRAACTFLRAACTFPAFSVKHFRQHQIHILQKEWCDTWCDHWCDLHSRRSILYINQLSARCKRCGSLINICLSQSYDALLLSPATPWTWDALL